MTDRHQSGKRQEPEHRLVFGRDTIPTPWEPTSPSASVECLRGHHLVDYTLGRCTECRKTGFGPAWPLFPGDKG